MIWLSFGKIWPLFGKVNLHTKEFHRAVQFLCEAGCGRVFKRAVHRDSHQKGCRGREQREHACSLCPHRYVQASHLKRHMAAKHSEATGSTAGEEVDQDVSECGSLSSPSPLSSPTHPYLPLSHLVNDPALGR